MVHNALRAFFDLPVRRRTPRVAVDLVRTGWKDEGFAGPLQSAEWRERAGDWVAEYVAGLDVTMEPVGLERWVSAPVNGSRTGLGVESDWAMGCSVAWPALAGLLVRQYRDNHCH